MAPQYVCLNYLNLGRISIAPFLARPVAENL
jgi:hypothetical protein